MTKQNRSTPFCIKLAGVVIRIEPIYAYIQAYCKEYLTNESECFTIRIEETDISYERERAQKDAEKELAEAIEYSDAYLETLAVYRKIAEKLLQFNVILFHGSVIAVDGVAYLFTAKSGTGKSTHTSLWRTYFGDRAVMVNDDKPLLEITKTGILAHGTPWNGKHRLSTNIAVPLKAICILTRGVENHIQEIKPSDAYAMLLQQTYRPADRNNLIQTLQLIDKLTNQMKFFKLACNMELQAAEVAYLGMRE